MIKERAKELSDILLAYSQGMLIQISNNGNHWVEWNATNPDSIFNYNHYRIKPQPKLVPFTFEDNKLFRDKWIIEKIDRNFIGKITGFTNSQIQTTMQCIGYITLFKEYEFENGSPCGKYINE